MPRETLIIIAIIILYSTVLTLYLTMTGRITLLPVLAGNATVSQGVVKVSLMAFGATYRITGITPLGGVCRLTGARINNASSSPTPPWVLRSGQSVVFTFNCTNAGKIIVTYNNGRTLIINIPGSHSSNYTQE
jgi:hypothetical protein